TFLAEGHDLVVTVGGDGTLLAASHGIGPGIGLLGVNSAPSHSLGFFWRARGAHAHAGRAQRRAPARPRPQRGPVLPPVPGGDLALHPAAGPGPEEPP